MSELIREIEQAAKVGEAQAALNQARRASATTLSIIAAASVRLSNDLKSLAGARPDLSAAAEFCKAVGAGVSASISLIELRQAITDHLKKLNGCQGGLIAELSGESLSQDQQMQVFIARHTAVSLIRNGYVEMREDHETGVTADLAPISR